MPLALRPSSCAASSPRPPWQTRTCAVSCWGDSENLEGDHSLALDTCLNEPALSSFLGRYKNPLPAVGKRFSAGAAAEIPVARSGAKGRAAVVFDAETFMEMVYLSAFPAPVLFPHAAYKLQARLGLLTSRVSELLECGGRRGQEGLACGTSRVEGADSGGRDGEMVLGGGRGEWGPRSKRGFVRCVGDQGATGLSLKDADGGGEGGGGGAESFERGRQAGGREGGEAGGQYCNALRLIVGDKGGRAHDNHRLEPAGSPCAHALLDGVDEIGLLSLSGGRLVGLMDGALCQVGDDLLDGLDQVTAKPETVTFEGPPIGIGLGPADTESEVRTGRGRSPGPPCSKTVARRSGEGGKGTSE